MPARKMRLATVALLLTIFCRRFLPRLCSLRLKRAAPGAMNCSTSCHWPLQFARSRSSDASSESMRWRGDSSAWRRSAAIGASVQVAQGAVGRRHRVDDQVQPRHGRAVADGVLALVVEPPGAARRHVYGLSTDRERVTGLTGQRDMEAVVVIGVGAFVDVRRDLALRLQ